MLIEAFLSQGAATMDYKKVLKKRLLLLSILLVLGVITIVFSLTVTFKGTEQISDFLKGLYLGVGVGIIVSSVILIIRINMTLKDEKKMKQKRIEEQDERNQLIMQKSFYYGSIVSMVIMYLAVLVAGIFNIVVFWTLLVIMVINFLVFLCTYTYFTKKM